MSGTRTGEAIDRANAEAIRRVLAATPVLTGVARAGDVIPELGDDLLLHAGPPIAWERMAGPVRGAVIGALLYERRARTEAEAAALAASGRIRFEPCHEHSAVGPMAGIISPSMPVCVVENRTGGTRAYTVFNEGYGKVLRYGAYDDSVVERLRWIEGTLGPVIGRALELAGGLDMKALISQALQMGDEGHNRNKAGSALFSRLLGPFIVRTGAPAEQQAEVLRFLADNDIFMLNPVMAACKATMDAAHGIPHSTLVTTMARNGTDFGIRVSGLGDRWFTGPSEVPRGLYFPGFTAEDGNPDMGDSAITETAGIGAFAMAGAPAIVTFIGGAVRDAVASTLEMYEITMAEHEAYRIPALDFRGTPTGIDVRKVIRTGILPRINTGIAHRQAGIGQVGAGLVRPPRICFEDALRAMAEAV
ncbi:MAG: YlbE family protein [bacterium]